MKFSGKNGVLLSISFVFAVFLGVVPAGTANIQGFEILGNPATGNNYSVAVTNSSVQSGLVARIEAPLHPPRNINMSYSGERFLAEIPGGMFGEKGVYRFRILNGSNNINGSYSLGSGNNTVYSHAWNYSVHNASDTSFCAFGSGDFTCEREDYQGLMMASQVAAYRNTLNDTFRKRALNFSLGKWGSNIDTLIACASSGGKIDCSNDYGISSGSRQGGAIYGLWESYGLTINATVYNRAIKYTLGSAENCDVWGRNWNKSFKCDSSRSQGLMALGYWNAYEETRNNTFRSIAYNLSDTNYSDPRLALAYWKGYHLTGNNSLRQKARNKTFKWFQECLSNCSTVRQSVTARSLWEGYVATGKEDYYLRGLEYEIFPYNSTCSDDYACEAPDQQGWTTMMAWDRFRAQKDEIRGFSNPVIDSRISGEDIDISVDLKGRLENPEAVLSSIGVRESCDLGFDGKCSFPASTVANQTAYHLYFRSNTTRYPEKGNLSFSLSLGRKDVESRVGSLTFTENFAFCDIWGSGDTTCSYPDEQAAMIKGMTWSHRLLGYSNISRQIEALATSDYSAGNTLCSPADNRFDCMADGGESGSQHQGAVMDALFEAYSETGNKTVYRIAVNFTQGSAEDCDVWAGDYVCDNSEGQGRMINGYMSAYKVTGNQTYFNKAENLSAKSLNATNGSKVLANALWEAYERTGNTTYRSKAENLTGVGHCFSGCSLFNYSMTGRAYRNAFQNTFNESYRQSVSDLYSGDFNCGSLCGNPKPNGTQLIFYSEAYDVLDVKFDYTTGLELSASTVTLGDTVDATCSITNDMQNTTLRNTTLSLSTGQRLSTGSSGSFYAGDIAYGETGQKTWNLQASEVGEATITCDITSKTGVSDQVQETVTVEEEQQTSGTGGDASTPVFRPVQPDYPLNYSYSVRPANLTGSEGWLFNSSCFSAERTVYENGSELEVGYSCFQPADIYLNDPGSINSSMIFENFTGRSMTIDYGEKTDNRTPLIAYRPIMPENQSLEVNYTVPRFLNTSSDFYTVEARLSEEIKCSVYRNDRVVYSGRTDRLNYNMSLEEGRNDVKIECGNQTRSFILNSQGQVQDDGMPAVVAVMVLLGVAAVLIDFRSEIGEAYRSFMFDWYTSRFEESLRSGEQAEALRNYPKMKHYSSGGIDISDYSYGLQRAVRIYVTLDLVSSGEDEGLDIGEKQAAINMAESFLEKSDNPDVNSFIKKKLEELR